MNAKEKEILRLWDKYKSHMSLDDFLIEAAEYADDETVEVMRVVIQTAQEPELPTRASSTENNKLYPYLYRAVKRLWLPRVCNNCDTTLPGLSKPQILQSVFVLPTDSFEGAKMLANLFQLGEMNRW